MEWPRYHELAEIIPLALAYKDKLWGEPWDMLNNLDRINLQTVGSRLDQGEREVTVMEYRLEEKSSSNGESCPVY